MRDRKNAIGQFFSITDIWLLIRHSCSAVLSRQAKNFGVEHAAAKVYVNTLL